MVIESTRKISVMRKLLSSLLIACVLVVSGCTSTGMQIGTSMTLCCPGDYENYNDYGLTTEDMPIFLRDYVMEEFDLAFQAKGIERDDRFNDLRVVLRYNHVNLDPESEDIDPFIRVESISVELNYIAQIEVEMYETSSNELVWAGSISRFHQVTPGEYMHEERAAPAFLSAFATLLVNYPAASQL